jgi:hypothetical protein
VSLKTPYPLVRKLLFNEELLDLKLIDKKLIENNNVFELEKVLVKSTFMVAGSFLLSAFLNFFLTKYIVVSPAGTAAFNEELGTLTAISYPAIALPSTAVMFVALYYIFKQITKLTGLSFEEIMSEQIKEKSK